MTNIDSTFETAEVSAAKNIALDILQRTANDIDAEGERILGADLFVSAADKIVTALLASGADLPDGLTDPFALAQSAEARFDEHLKGMISRVIDVFEEADEDDSAQDVLPDVLDAMRVVQTYTKGA